MNLADQAAQLLEEVTGSQVERVAVFRPLDDGTVPGLAVIDGIPKEFLLTRNELYLRDPETREDAGIPYDGEVLSEDQYEELSEIDEEDIRAATEDWTRTAPERFKGILDADQS